MHKELDDVFMAMNTNQLAAISSLVYLAAFEKSTLRYQWQAWSSRNNITSLVPLEVIEKCELYNPDLSKLGVIISVYVLTDLTNIE